MAEVNVTDVTWSIQKLGYNCTDPHMDGYYQWGQKQKLYQILWETERQLRKCPAFYGEDDWLTEHKQEAILNKLKGN
jgi:hypothetical protein